MFATNMLRRNVKEMSLLVESECVTVLTPIPFCSTEDIDT